MNIAVFVEATWQFATLMLFQSTLLIAGVFVVVKLCRTRGAALLSVIYRSTLLAVLVAPILTFAMMRSEVSGWRPRHWSSAPIAISQASIVQPIPREDSLQTKDSALRASVEERAGNPLPYEETEPVPTSVPVIGRPVVLPPVPNATSQPSVTLKAKMFICFGWFGVSLVLLVRHWRARRSLWKTLAKAVPVDPSIQSLCDRLAGELRVHSPRVVCSPYYTSPFLAGVFSPIVHLASDDSGEASDDGDNGLRDILIHELAHLKRHDLWMRMMHHVVLSWFFFQPLLWRLVRRIEISAEDVCDDYAMSHGARRDRYAGRLVDLAERLDFPLSSAVGIASGKSMLKHRVTRIMDSRRDLSMRVSRRALLMSGLVTVFAVFSVGMMLTPASMLTAADEPPSELPSESVRGNSSTQQWPQDIVRGTIYGKSGPLAGAEVFWWRSRVHDMEPMQPIRVVTDMEGKFELQRTPPNPNDPAIWDMREEMLIRGQGHAFERTGPQKFGASIPIDPDWPGQRDQVNRFSEPVLLAAEGSPVTGRLVDIEGQPIADARVRIRWFSQERGTRNSGLNLFRSRKLRTEKDRIRGVASLVNSIEHVPLRDALPNATTDADGRFRLTELPGDCLFELLIEGEGIQSTDLVVQNYGGNEVTIVPQADGFDHNPPTKVYPGEFQTVIGPSVPVVGTVTDAESGEPVSGAVVQTNFVFGERLMSSRERQHLATRTDERGHYRINGLPVGAENKVVVFATGNVPYMPIRSDVDTSSADDIVEGERTLNFQLKKGIWAEGRVYEPETGESFQGEISYYWFRNRELEATYPGNLFARLDGRYFTDSNGRFRIPVLRTPGVIAFSTGNRDHKRMAVYSRGYGENELSGYRSPDGSFPYFDTAPSFLMPGNYNRLALIDPKANESVVKVDMPLGKSKPIPVTILNPDGKPATEELEIYGGNERSDWLEKSPEGFVVEDLLPDQRRKVFAFDRMRNLVGGTIVDHEKGKTFEIKLAPAGTAGGRLIDGDGNPIADATLTIEYGDFQNDDTTATWARQIGKNYMPSELTVDEQGKFKVFGLSSNWKYSARVSSRNENAMSRIIGRAFQGLTIEPGEDRDLGDVVIKGE